MMESQDVQKRICPHCGYDKMHKDGFAYTKDGRVQQYQCDKCHRRTTKPVIKKGG
jgi:transposase-like protein